MPLTCSPSGALRTTLGAAVIAVLATSHLAGQARGDVAFLRKAAITVAEVHQTIRLDSSDPITPPSPVPLTRRQLKELRSVIVTAVKRNIADDEEGKRVGAIPPGAGCVSNEYEVTFQVRAERETAVLHVRGGWMSGGSRVGLINFDSSDRQRLANLFGVSLPCR